MRLGVPLPDELIKRLAGIPSLQAAVLFGSYARGEVDRRSDVDLLLIFDSREDIKRSEGELLTILKEYRELPLAFTKRCSEDLARDPSFNFNVFKEGCVLYKRPDVKLLPAALTRERPAIVYRYELGGLPHERKVKFNSAFFTRRKGKYRYPGLLERVGGERLGPGVVLVPAGAEREVDGLFSSYEIKPKKCYAILTAPVK